MTEKQHRLVKPVAILALVILCLCMLVIPASAIAPTSDFSGVPTIGEIPLTVIFTDASVGVPDTWNWSFGDSGTWVNGTTAAEQNPTHIYTAVGTYTVTLICNNTDGVDTETKVGYITAVHASPLFTPIDPYTIDYPNLSLLIGGFAGIFPGFISLVVGVLPILIVLWTLGVVVTIIGVVVILIGRWF